MKKAIGFLLIAFCVVSLGVILRPNKDAQPEEFITVYCAAGLKKPITAIAEQFADELGIGVQIQYGGTGTLLSQLRVAGQGDLFIAADQGSLDDAEGFGVIQERLELLRQYPVVAVAEGNPKSIESMDDLWRDDVRVAVGNPEAASIGKATQKGLGAHWDDFAPRIAVTKPTVTEIATDLTLGAVDAAIVWNSTVPQFEGLEALRLPEFDAQAEIAGVAVLESCDQTPQALQFARFLTAPERGVPTFESMGFEPVPGDTWALRPNLILYSGGVNRPAIETLLKEFSNREGVEMTTVFNGCGVLCAQMEAMAKANDPNFPDAYYACDECFVPPVKEFFREVSLLTETDIGIVVQEGNPKAIRSLADLAQEGLRIGLCNQTHSTLGFMTAGMLRSTGLETSVRKNVVYESPTADLLVGQMVLGELDAAVIYRVNFQLQDDKLDLIPINHEGARAVQPFAVRHDSPKKELARRLLNHFKANGEAFEDSGFDWRQEQDIQSSDSIETPEYLQTGATYADDSDSE